MKAIFVSILAGFFIIASGFYALGEDKYSVSGEIAYWLQDGIIVVSLKKEDEKIIVYGSVPKERILKIELSPQEGQEGKLIGETVPFKFIDVPKGEYGIICFIDKNNNGKLDYPEGVTPGTAPPIEPYAFSGPRSSGKPQWKDYSFDVDKNVNGIKIKLPFK